MAMKKNNDWVIVALLVLALFGKGALATPPAPKTSTMDGSSGSTGNNSGNTDMGVNSRNSPGPDSTNMPGGTPSGSPDKSRAMSPPGTMPGMATFMLPSNTVISSGDNPGVQFAQNQINLINEQKGSAVAEDNNTFLVNNLGGTPGASVTTAVYNPVTGMYDMFSNNQYLFSMVPPGKTPGMSIPEMVKQPSPPMNMMVPTPASIPPPKSMPSPMIQPPIIPPMNMGTGLVTIMTNIKIPGMSNAEMVKQPSMNFANENNPAYVRLQQMLKMMNVPMPLSMKDQSTVVPNPLSKSPGLTPDSLFSMLQSNLQSNSSGLGSLLGLIGIPGIPAIPNIFPDIMV